MSRQGMRPNRSAWHNGIDLGAPVGTPVYPAAAGTVYKVVTSCPPDAERDTLSRREIRQRGGPCACPNCTTDTAGKNCGSTYGNYVVVKHGDNFYTLYAHLDTVLVTTGQAITTSTQLGTVGTTTSLLVGTGEAAEPSRCTSMAPHLHLEVDKSWPLASSDTASRYDVLHELAAGGVVVVSEGLAAAGVATAYSEPALRGLAGFRVTKIGAGVVSLAVTNVPIVYNEPALRIPKGYMKAQSVDPRKAGSAFDPTAGAEPAKKPSKWPLYVSFGALVLVGGLVTWNVSRRRSPGRLDVPGAGGNPRQLQPTEKRSHILDVRESVKC